MTSLLAGTLEHGVRGSRGVSKSHCSCLSPELPGTLLNSPVVALTTLSLFQTKTLIMQKRQLNSSVLYSKHMKFLLTRRRGPSMTNTGKQSLGEVIIKITLHVYGKCWELSGRVLDLRPRDTGFEPHRHQCIVVLEQDTFILA